MVTFINFMIRQKYKVFHPQVLKCFGCSGLLKPHRKIPPIPEDLPVVAIMPRQYTVESEVRMRMEMHIFVLTKAALNASFQISQVHFCQFRTVFRHHSWTKFTF